MTNTSYRFALLLWIPAGFVGCNKTNPFYCPGAKDNDCSQLDAAPDSPPAGCTSNQTCSGSDAVCNLVSGACVQCLGSDATACVGTTPTCGNDDTCRACVAHSDCASEVCLPDGSCGDDANVAYIDPAGTDNATCTKAAPCIRVSKALATARPFVKFTGTTDEATTVSGGRIVTFLANPGAVLTRTAANGAIVTVSGDGTALTVYDLSISNAPNGSSGIGLVIPAAGGSPKLILTRAKVSNNPGGGISASGGTLTVSRSTISANAGGGLSISGAQFDITNSFITQNGAATTSFGGVSFAQLGAGSHLFDFNTVTGNVAATGTTTGVVCSLVTQLQTFSDNIIFGNQGAGSGTQISGNNCATTFSDIGPDTASGTGNINADPLFVNVSQSNFHIMTGSPAKDVADPAATLHVDFDGDVRPQGVHSDMGADETP